MNAPTLAALGAISVTALSVNFDSDYWQNVRQSTLLKLAILYGAALSTTARHEPAVAATLLYYILVIRSSQRKAARRAAADAADADAAGATAALERHFT